MGHLQMARGLSAFYPPPSLAAPLTVRTGVLLGGVTAGVLLVCQAPPHSAISGQIVLRAITFFFLRRRVLFHAWKNRAQTLAPTLGHTQVVKTVRAGNFDVSSPCKGTPPLKRDPRRRPACFPTSSSCVAGPRPPLIRTTSSILGFTA